MRRSSRKGIRPAAGGGARAARAPGPRSSFFPSRGDMADEVGFGRLATRASIAGVPPVLRTAGRARSCGQRGSSPTRTSRPRARARATACRAARIRLVLRKRRIRRSEGSYGPFGRSRGWTNPCRRHPMRASQVRASATGRGPLPRTTGGVRHPANHGADEHGSIPFPTTRCFRKFMRTYTSAWRTARGVVSART